MARAGWLLAAAGAFVTLSSLVVWKYIAPSSTSERKDFVQIVSQLVAGTTLVVGLFFTWSNMEIAQQTSLSNQVNTERTLRLSESGQVAERFTNAIDQLGNSQSTAIRIGGVYALEQIARYSSEYRRSVQDILSTFVREHAEWEDPDDNPTRKHREDDSSPPGDIQAIITVLGRPLRQHEDPPLYLPGVDLRNMHMEGAHFEQAVLWGANLSGSVLTDAHLDGARLTGANFNNVNFQHATLDGALLSGTSLVNADLTNASMAGTFIQSSWFTRATLTGLRLTGADLRGAINLDRQQLTTAITDDTTKLPAN